MAKSISVLIIMLGMLVSSLIADTTYVSGIINTNTVWSPAGSPYVITHNVLVDTGVRLEIEPGVKVLFNYDKYLTVKGTLKAIGTEQDSITFTALDATQTWRRLWFKPEAFACSLKYCRISYANNSAIYNEDTDTLYIGYSTITNNSANFGGGISNFGTVTITNNTITNNSADWGGGISNFGTVTITNNTITNNSASDGGGISNLGTVTITNNTITNNSAYFGGGGGIYNYSGTATITNNTITNNSAYYGGGIGNSSAVTITNNTITNNSADWGGGIYNNYGTTTITNNTIIDSTASTIRIEYGSIRLNYNNLNNLNPTRYTVYNNTADTINARNNYWFTVDTLVIAQKIYDFWDDNSKGEVYYRPFLTAPVPGIEEKDANETHSLAMRSSVKIFPNPASSVIRVRAPFAVNKVTMYDVTGKIVKEMLNQIQHDNTVQISLAGIKNGVYFVKVNDVMVKEKLIITK